MKSKQLANVLIKATGLYVGLCAIPRLIPGVAGVLIQLTVCMVLVAESRRLVELWFKNEGD